LVTLAVGVFNLVLALFLAKVLGWGLYGLAGAGAISLTLRRFVFTPLYVAAVLHQPYKTYYQRVVPIMVATLTTIALCRLVMSFWTISNRMDLAMAATAVSVLFAAITCLLLPPEERAALKDMVMRWKE